MKQTDNDIFPKSLSDSETKAYRDGYYAAIGKVAEILNEMLSENAPEVYIKNPETTAKKSAVGKSAKANTAETDKFEEFWRVYPNKAAKKAAKTAWSRIKLTDELLEKILTSVENHKTTKQWKNGIIPHAATFLNGERWNDTTDNSINRSCGIDEKATVDVSFEIMRRALAEDEGDISN